MTDRDRSPGALDYPPQDSESGDQQIDLEISKRVISRIQPRRKKSSAMDLVRERNDQAIIKHLVRAEVPDLAKNKEVIEELIRNPKKLSRRELTKQLSEIFQQQTPDHKMQARKQVRPDQKIDHPSSLSLAEFRRNTEQNLNSNSCRLFTRPYYTPSELIPYCDSQIKLGDQLPASVDEALDSLPQVSSRMAAVASELKIPHEDVALYVASRDMELQQALRDRRKLERYERRRSQSNYGQDSDRHKILPGKPNGTQLRNIRQSRAHGVYTVQSASIR